MARDKMSQRRDRLQAKDQLAGRSRRGMTQEEIDAEKELLAKSDKPEPIKADAATGRNDPCPCGSGKKFKKCCGKA